MNMQHIITVQTPMAKIVPRTKADYRADLIREYGNIPTPAELAEKENIRFGFKPKSPDRREMSPEDIVRLDALRRRAKAKTAATTARILAALVRPMTAAELESILGMSRQGIGSHLRGAYDRGEVIRDATSRVTVWSKA